MARIRSGWAAFPWLRGLDLAPFTGLVRAAVLGPPFRAGDESATARWEARSRAFSLCGFSRALWLKPSTEKPRSRDSRRRTEAGMREECATPANLFWALIRAIHTIRGLIPSPNPYRRPAQEDGPSERRPVI
jgi:hypothetical protein